MSESDNMPIGSGSSSEEPPRSDPSAPDINPTPPSGVENPGAMPMGEGSDRPHQDPSRRKEETPTDRERQEDLAEDKTRGGQPATSGNVPGEEEVEEDEDSNTPDRVEDDPVGNAFLDSINKVIDKNNSNVDGIIEGANAVGIPLGEIINQLRKVGREDLIPEIINRKGELAEDFQQASEEDKDLYNLSKDILGKVKDASDPANNMTDEQREEVFKEAEGFVQNIATPKTGLNKRLFDEETGLFRKERRVKRLVIKPGVTILIALIITYMALLHAVTKSASTRVGHS